MLLSNLFTIIPSACASQFHATNIIAIVREGDKGLFVKFRTPLRVCPNADNPSPQSIYDKRFGACISVVCSKHLYLQIF